MMMSAETISKQAIRWVDALNNFLKVLQYDKRVARDKFFTNEGWQANIKSLDINGVSEYFYDETDDDDVEFLSFIDGNGFEVKYVGAFSKSHTSLAYVLSVKKC